MQDTKDALILDDRAEAGQESHFPLWGHNTQHPEPKGEKVQFASSLKAVSPQTTGSKAEMSWQRGMAEERCLVYGD